MSVSSRDRYFATEPAEEIGPKLVERVQGYGMHPGVMQVDARLAQAWRYYYGYSPEGFHATSSVGRGGSEGELAEIRINHSRSLVQTLLNLIVSPKFVWTPRAANIDYEAVRQTELAASILEHYWHNKNVSAYATRAVESGIFLTEGFIHVDWDEAMGDDFIPDPENPGGIIKTGDLRFSNVSPWDVIRDPMKRSWDELNWVVIRQYKNKYDLATKYPDKAEKVLDSPSEVPQRTVTPTVMPWSTEDIALFTFYHRPTASLPMGRTVVFLASGEVLEDKALEFGVIPLHRVSCGELDGTPFGYSPYLEILGIQELMDSINSSLATNISTFATQSIAVEEGTPVHPDDLGGGMKIIYYRQGGTPPQPLQLTKSPPEAFKFLDELKAHEELLMGLNNVVRGQMQSGKESGAALALLQSQAIQQASVLQSNYIQMLQGLGATVLRVFQKRAVVPLRIGIVGSSRSDLVRETQVTGDLVSKVDQVYVEMGNPVSQTAAGRFELGKLLVQMGVVKTPQAIVEVLETGRLDPLTKGEQEELLNVLRENQDLVKGITPSAMLQDDHLLHCKEHSAAVASPAARRDPEVLRSFREHVHQHYSLWYGVPYAEVESDPLYRPRMLLICGKPVPPDMGPPPTPPGAPPPGLPPPPPPGAMKGGPPPDQLISSAVEAPGQGAEDMLPMQPKNPSTGQRWNAVDGGGAVPR